MFFLCLTASLYLMLPVSYTLSISAMPGVNNIGYVTRGNTYLIDFYLLSDASEEVTVSLSYSSPHPSIYTSRHIPNFNASLASQEDISSWVGFEKKYVVIPPSKKYFPEANVWANERVGVILTVPKDAEPGFHAGSITISPMVQPSTPSQGTGVEVISVIRPIFIFRVPGEAIRSGHIIGFSVNRVSDDSADVRVYFKNNGTVTYSARVDYLEIKNGSNIIAKLSSPYQSVAPFDESKSQNGMATFSMRWTGISSLPAGEYEVEARVSWITGSTVARGKIALEPYFRAEKKEITQKPEVKPGREQAIASLILVMFTIMIIYLVVKYGRRKEKHGFRKK